MYKCCFLACFCASRRVQRRKAELTLAQIREKLPNGWADWHQIWHTCANSYGNGYIRQANCSSRHMGGGGFRGSTIKKYGELKLSDWHQLWFTSADSSGNGHKLNTSHPSIPHWGVGGHKFKSLGKLSNGYTGWHLIWYTSADSSWNGHRLNTIRPTIPQGHFVFFRGSQIQMFWEAVKRLDRLAPNLVQI